MKSLSKQQLQEKERIEGELREAFTKLEDAIEQYNLTLDQAWQAVQEAVDAHNAKVSEANDFASEVASDIESFVTDKSDKWQEGDRGQAYLAWQEAWNGDMDEVDLEKPDEISVPEDNVADIFADFPNEPEL